MAEWEAVIPSTLPTGQWYSHEPQPMQIASLTVGIFGLLLSPGVLCTIIIAPTGQRLAQLPQTLPSDAEIHVSKSTTAVPIFMLLFSALSIGFIAPVGQISEQAVHSGWQYPAIKAIEGCINPSKVNVGLSRLLGQD